MDTIPRVEVSLRVDHMKHEIVNAIMLQKDALEAQIEQAILAGIASFEWESQLRNMVHKTLESIVQYAIQHALYEAVNDSEVRTLLAETFTKKLREG